MKSLWGYLRLARINRQVPNREQAGVDELLATCLTGLTATNIPYEIDLAYRTALAIRSCLRI